MPNPLINIGAAVGDGTGEIGPRQWLQKINRLPNADSTINAGSGDYTGTTEQKITAAIADAVVKGYKYVWIPQSMLPYNASLVTFNTAVRMVREGGFVPGFDVIAYGAAADGVTNDSVAILAASSAANARSGGGTVYFSDFAQNLFAITSPLTFNTYTDVTLQGQGGPNQTRILMAASGAHCMNFTGVCSRITIRDFTLISNVAWGAGFGLSVVGTAGIYSDQFTVERVNIQNIPTPFNLLYCGNSTFRAVRYYQNVASATVNAVFTVASSVQIGFYDFYNTTVTGTLPSHVYVIDYDTDTLVFFNCTASKATGHGFRLLKSAGSTGTRLARFYACYSESNTQTGWSIEEGQDVRLIGCEAAVNTTHGYSITGGKAIELTSCFSLSNQQHGFDIEGGVTVGLNGCTASNNSQQTTNTYDGIRVAAAYTRVVGCRSGDFYLSLANKQRWGISIAAVDFLKIYGNDLDGNFSGPMQNFAAGQAHVFIQGTSTSSEAFKRLVTEVVTLADAANIAIDASAGEVQQVTIGGNRTMNAPTAGQAGQRIIFTIIQDGVGGRTLTWNAVFKVSWSDVGNTLSKRSSVSFWYDGVNWNQFGAQTPYV